MQIQDSSERVFLVDQLDRWSAMQQRKNPNNYMQSKSLEIPAPEEILSSLEDKIEKRQ